MRVARALATHIPRLPENVDRRCSQGGARGVGRYAGTSRSIDRSPLDADAFVDYPERQIAASEYEFSWRVPAFLRDLVTYEYFGH
jgi:hypothetical protein